MVKSVDLFGQSITLNINKESSYKTIFGGFSSILILVILIATFQSNISAFFEKSDVMYVT